MVASDEQESRKKKSHGMTWAQRLKRVFGIDIKMCGKCGGKVKVIAVIEEPAVIEKILKHLGLDRTVPQPSLPRGPPQQDGRGPGFFTTRLIHMTLCLLSSENGEVCLTPLSNATCLRNLFRQTMLLASP